MNPEAARAGDGRAVYPTRDARTDHRRGRNARFRSPPGGRGGCARDHPAVSRPAGHRRRADGGPGRRRGCSRRRCHWRRLDRCRRRRDPRSADALAVNGQGAGNVAAAALRRGRLDRARVQRSRFNAARSPCRMSSPTRVEPIQRLRAVKAGWRAPVVAAAAGDSVHHRAQLILAVRRSWEALSQDHLRWSAERTSCTWSATRSAVPTFTGHLRRRWSPLAMAPTAGVVAPAGRSHAPGRVRVGDRRRGRLDCEVEPDRHRSVSSSRAAAAIERAALGVWGAGAVAARVGLTRLHGRTGRRWRREAPGCAARQGFIGSTFVGCGSVSTATRRTRSTRSLRGTQGEPARGGNPRPLRARGVPRIPRRLPVRCAAEAIVNFAAETYVDRSSRTRLRSASTIGAGTHVPAGGRPRAGPALCPGSTDEVYGSIETGSSTSLTAPPVQPVQRHEDRVRSAGHQPAFHTYELETLVCRGSTATARANIRRSSSR